MRPLKFSMISGDAGSSSNIDSVKTTTCFASIFPSRWIVRWRDRVCWPRSSKCSDQSIMRLTLCTFTSSQVRGTAFCVCFSLEEVGALMALLTLPTM